MLFLIFMSQITLDLLTLNISAETRASSVFGVGEEDEDLDALPAAPKAPKKRRLDEVCLEQYPEHSRSVIQSWIAQGKVAINGRVITKAGTSVASQSAVQITAESPKFVCRAGLKLEGALDHFGLDVSGMRVLDAGLSTGGFTDCLLQRGASHVVGVDVGYGQVAERIRTDPRVTVMERTNLRYVQLEDLPERRPVDLATLDLSFISLLKVLPSVCGLLAPRAHLLALIKPQFEAGRDEVSKGGIVKDAKIHRKVIEKVTAGFEEAGFVPRGCIESPIKGAVGGNTEFLALFERTSRDVTNA
ncbi:g11634 [Coccomyxa elongata]